MPIVTDGLMMAPERGIHELSADFGSSIGATASEAWADSPISQFSRGNEIAKAAGSETPDFGEIASGAPTTSNGVSLTEDVKPAVPRMDMIEALDRVKKAGLEKHLTLPNQPDMPPAQLDIMIQNAQKRRENEATIERGPQGFIPSALQVGTSFLVGAVDPINVASAFIPVMGELRYGKLLASAGDSAAGRLAIRAGVGGAQGAVGQAALEPLDWWSHTQEGRDFGMADVLHNIMFGAALGGGLHAGGGFISDAYRGAKGRALYPFGPGEPVASRSEVGNATGAPPSSSPARAAEEVAAAGDQIPGEAPDTARTTVDINGERTVIDTDLAGVHSAEAERYSPPSGAVDIINDLPPRAHEDAMRGAIANLIDGEAVRSGDMLEAAAQTDPRIAESVNIAQSDLHLVRDPSPQHDDSFRGYVGGGDTVSYSIHGADGVPVGYAEFAIDGDTARILDVATEKFNGDREAYGDVRNSVGPRQMRQLLDQFRDLHPEVKKFTADRVSGARKGGAYDAGLKGNEIEIKLPDRSKRGRAAADPQTWSLYEFLAREGGLKPDQELNAIFGNAKGPFVPGFGPLVRQSGRSLDDALRLAKDHGYLFDPADVTGAEGKVAIRDLLDKVAEENSGRKQYRNDQQHTTKADDAAAAEREKHEIVAALHDEIEASTGQKGVKVDPALEDRVVQIVMKEGEHDVLAAYERAIMEDAERYEGLANGRRNNAETAHIPGWDAPDASAASRPGEAGAGQRGQTGLPGEGAGRADGGQPRNAGAGDRSALPAQLDKAAAWRGLAHARPDFNTPDIIAKSNEAAKVKPPSSKLDERVAAAAKADAYAQAMYDMFAHRLPEQDRIKLQEHLADLDRRTADNDVVSQRGAACLFEGGV